MPFPKRSGYRTRRQLAKAAYSSERPAVRAAAHELDGGRCVFPDCLDVVLLDSDNPHRLCNAHELRSRAQGGSPTDLDNVVSTCFECHMAMHTPVGGKTARIEAGPGGRQGPLVFWRKRDGEWIQVGVRMPNVEDPCRTT